jgi:hypothetical protein
MSSCSTGLVLSIRSRPFGRRYTHSDDEDDQRQIVLAVGQCFGWRLSIAQSRMVLPYRSGRGTSAVLVCGLLLVPGVGAGRQGPRPGRGGGWRRATVTRLRWCPRGAGAVGSVGAQRRLFT